MAHGNARLTPLGRQLLVGRIERQGWTITAAATAAGVSRQTASKWLARARCEGTCALADRRCRPHRVVYRLSGASLRPVVSLRLRLFGPAPIAWRLGLATSTVYRALRRLGLGRLRDLRPRATVVRYCWPAPGDLVHLDTKRLGRIGAGGGWRFAERSRRHRGIGWDLVHVAVDDTTRLAYAEELADERPAARRPSWSAPWPSSPPRASRCGACSPTTAALPLARLPRDCGTHGLRQLYTRPYRPQTNGKAEAFVKIVQNGWAYRRPYDSTAERIAALPGFLAYYNGYRPHGGLGGLTPMARLDRQQGHGAEHLGLHVARHGLGLHHRYGAHQQDPATSARHCAQGAHRPRRPERPAHTAVVRARDPHAGRECSNRPRPTVARGAGGILLRGVQKWGHQDTGSLRRHRVQSPRLTSPASLGRPSAVQPPPELTQPTCRSRSAGRSVEGRDQVGLGQRRHESRVVVRHAHELDGETAVARPRAARSARSRPASRRPWAVRRCPR